ncbi:DUF4434 domain-containing protein [Parabacteroides bouchesdurhonensis]|uniref:DUF4434 domain-containing protein n=1 Tax=Parabacteroides bouchesdurhonensis TaxID=1936995 RepID=UPI000E4FEB2B|nr:DUF4434 domain-containing protein [Parabacteroides bouchesdurhonensis]RHJ90853.1 DUF4434 domain-containing protein [Bacteroides sp. AM07-16]
MDRRKFLQLGGLAATAALVSNDLLAMDFKRNPDIKPVVGSWFEFYHHSRVGAKYWNPIFYKYTDEQWRAKIKDIHELGMEYLVLLSVADNGKTFYPSKLQPRYDLASPDPLETVLSAADEYGMKFFISNDYWGDFREVEKMMTSKEVAALRAKGMEEVAEKYSHHKSFYGWYYPNETNLAETMDDTTIAYVNDSSRLVHELTPHCKTMIAPYGTYTVKADDYYARQLERLDVDIIAYQDEVGVQKSKAGEVGKYFEALSKAHEKAGRAKIWADLEIFDFEGKVYTSPAIPSTFDRLLIQMADVSPFVEKILIYQYSGLMSKPGSIATLGQPKADKFYSDYAAWLKAQK